MKKKLAIISTHPIQYNAPMFALLAKSEKVYPKIFYTWSQSKESLYDKDFGKTISWDIPLLDGYDYEFVENVSENPGPQSYKGIICPDLISKIIEYKPDALLIFGWNFHAHYNVMQYFKRKVPVYFRGDSTLLDENKNLKQIIRRIILKYVYKKVDYAFYVGKNNKEYFLKHGINESNLFFAPHAIDNLRFNDSSGTFRIEAKKWRKELGISDENIVVLFVGKFEHKKNPQLLIEAAKKLNNNNVHFIFVGNGILENELKSSAFHYSNIHFIPFQNQSKMPIVYQLCDILALPSQGPGETWGLAVNEAMACAKSIFVSNKCGCAVDLVENGKNGYIFESGNLTDCLKALQKLSESKKNCIEMGNYSLKKIQEWSFQKICESIENHL